MLQLEIEGRNQQERDVALYTDDTWSIGILNKKTSLYIKISSHRLRSATKAFQLNSCLFFFVFGRRWWKLNWQERAEDKGVFRHAFYLIDGMMNSLDETESTWGRIERMYWVQYSVGKSNNRIWKLIRFSRFEKGEDRLSTRWHITNWNAYAPFCSVGINQLGKHGNSWQSIVHRNKKTYLNETSTCFPPALRLMYIDKNGPFRTDIFEQIGIFKFLRCSWSDVRISQLEEWTIKKNMQIEPSSYHRC